MHTVTLTLCRRPEYTRRTIAALKACTGINDYEVGVFVDRQCEATLAVVHDMIPASWHLVVSQGRWGCNVAIRNALRWGFALSEFHVHLEDDTLPAKDFLSFCRWASQCGVDPSVLSVTGYARDNEPADVAHRRDWFSCWGWGTWRDRWEQLDAVWAPDGPVAWDTNVHNRCRNGRVEIAPGLSRIQNIGEHGGQHNSPAIWRDCQWTPHFAGDQEHDVQEWRLV